MNPELIIMEQEGGDAEVIMTKQGDAEQASPEGQVCRDTTSSDTPRPTNRFGSASGAVRRKKPLGLLSAASILALALGLLLGFVARSRSDEGASPKARASVILDDDPSLSPSIAPSLGPSVSGQPSSIPSVRPTLSEAPSSSPSVASSTIPSLSPSASGQPSSSPSAKPTISEAPSLTPSGEPSLSEAPSLIPSGEPSLSRMPSGKPSSQPSTSNSPTLSFGPTQSPSNSPTTSPTTSPTISPTTSPTVIPTTSPTISPTTSSPPTPAFIDPRCFTVATYNSIDRDVAQIANGIESLAERSHFLGGIVRLVAHDFMDYDRTSTPMYGPDGCFDLSDGINSGLPEDIWCDECPLTLVYNRKYRPNNIGRADFWVAAGNAVIRQTSINNALDMRSSFRWGRQDRFLCPGSGDRLPGSTGCAATEAAMIERMGLTWRDAVALMGAHTLGRGDTRFSGHHGTWSDSDEAALVFDKRYYDAAHDNSWRPRFNPDQTTNDFTTGNGRNNRMMLKTDLCLTMDVRNVDTDPCCVTHFEKGAGDKCVAARFEAFEEMRSSDSGTNQPFYSAFEDAWS
ncbi:hypothetical protein THAOC_21860 [Thalassiosira oceanica]|uniref:Plant heme peroxidase family profile domain-containing protein n=1 Tax=Thalassiosira oceanica TaxID=159749 RepID=K0SHP6_THAOC|nr:hypothetical protein THAOC_21860 [Thalassiosira oceanica]|eukprot:EJK58042.1 hypothetical protein THAOC_21860 [Thalassiosira oceanica]